MNKIERNPMTNREIEMEDTESKVINYLRDEFKPIKNYNLFDARIPAEGIPAINGHYPCPQFKPFDIKKFGKYFNKCCGKLNSIIKEDGFYVCKDRIGLKVNGRKRNVYAGDDDMFVILDPRHLNLVCNKQKADVMNDFVSLKNEIIVKIQEIETKIKRLFPDELKLSKAINILYKIPNRMNGVVGYHLMEPEIVPLSEQTLTLNFGSLTSLLEPISRYTADSYIYMINKCVQYHMVFSFTIKDTVDYVYRYNNERERFLTKRVGNNYKYKYTQLIRVDNCQNLVYDFNPELIYNEFVKEYEMLVEWYDDALEKLKQKYTVNWVLNAFGDSDCLI